MNEGYRTLNTTDGKLDRERELSVIELVQASSGYQIDYLHTYFDLQPSLSSNFSVQFRGSKVDTRYQLSKFIEFMNFEPLNLSLVGNHFLTKKFLAPFSCSCRNVDSRVEHQMHPCYLDASTVG